MRLGHLQLSSTLILFNQTRNLDCKRLISLSSLAPLFRFANENDLFVEVVSESRGESAR